MKAFLTAIYKFIMIWGLFKIEDCVLISPISKDNVPKSFSQLFKKFRQRPLKDQYSLLLRIIRGYLVSGKLDESAWPLVDRGVRLQKHHGYISVGRFVKFEGNCQIVVSGTEKKLAKFCIGEFSSIGPSTVINVADRLDIGERCLISWNCDIMDTSFHKIRVLEGEAEQPVNKPVEIGNDVWIGAHCLILPGATIGDNCVIGAGSVVTGVIPPNSLAAGNPARVIRQIAGWER